MKVDFDEFVWDTFVRVRVLFDIFKFFRRVQRIRDKKGNIVAVDFKYERFFIFCFICGIVGYIDRDCSLADEDLQAMEVKWGVWIRVFLRRGGENEG